MFGNKQNHVSILGYAGAALVQSGRSAPMIRSTALPLALIAGVVVMVSLLVKGPASSPSSSAGEERLRVASPTWIRPATIKELVRDSTHVVEAEVVGIRRGDDLGRGRKYSPQEPSLPTQRVTFRTLDVLRGDPALRTFDVFRVGSEQLLVEGDPNFRRGERYVLFIHPRQPAPGEPREPDLFITTGPDGRLRANDRGRFEAVIDGGVADRLDNKDKKEINDDVIAAS